MKVMHWDEAEDGPLTGPDMRWKLERMGYTVMEYSYPPGTCFPPHTHNVDKINGVLSGRFEITMGGKSAILKAGDMLAVPKGELHSAEVVGDEPVVSLDAVKGV